MTTDQVISGVTGFATFLAASATFLTVWQIAKQRRASYRPELVISRILFEMLYQERPWTIESLAEWREVDSRQEMASNTKQSPSLSQGFSLRLVNIGLGAAKDISVLWDFPFESFIRKINECAQSKDLPTIIEYKKGTISTKDPQVTSFWNNQRRSSLDYVLPATVEHMPTDLQVPLSYILAVATAVYVFFHPDVVIKEFIDLDIPPLNAIVTCEDVAGDKHTAEYDIYLEIHVVHRHLCAGSLQPKKKHA